MTERHAPAKWLAPLIFGFCVFGAALIWLASIAGR